MKKLKKFIYELTKVTIEWETLTKNGRIEFSLIHVLIVIAIIIFIWTR